MKEPQRLRTFYQSAEADAVAGMRDPDPSTEPNLEEQKKGVYRQDREAIMGVIRQLEPLSREAGQTPAASLIAATPNLEWQHPIGARHEDWSYESGAAAKVADCWARRLAPMCGVWGRRSPSRTCRRSRRATSGNWSPP